MISHGVIGKCHRMSWEHFYGPIPNSLWVLHKCDRPCCINPMHLFLGTAQDNADDMIAKGRARHPVGVNASRVRLTDDIVREIRHQHTLGLGYKKLAKMFGIHRSHAAEIIKRKIWNHVD